MSKATDLENRLINSSVDIFTQTINIANTPDYRSPVDQVRRSSTSPALNYGEANLRNLSMTLYINRNRRQGAAGNTQCISDPRPTVLFTYGKGARIGVQQLNRNLYCNVKQRNATGINDGKRIVDW